MNAKPGREAGSSYRTAVTLTPLSVEARVTVGSEGTSSAGEFVARLLGRNNVAPKDHDVLVLSSKVISFCEGDVIHLSSVKPRPRARVLGRIFGKDPRKVELILRTGPIIAIIPLKWIMSIRSVRQASTSRAVDPDAMLRGYTSVNAFVFIVRAHAAYLDDAGIDYANTPDGHVSILPNNPCAVAAKIREGVHKAFGTDIAVIITDTVTMLGRIGTQDIAIGYSGIDPTTRDSFSKDLFGTARSGGMDLVVDSIAGMAGLIMGQTTEMTPGVLVHGVHYTSHEQTAIQHGTDELAYPRGATWKMGLMGIVATALFLLVELFTLPVRWCRSKSGKSSTNHPNTPKHRV